MSIDGPETRARILTWNLERRSSTSPRAATALDHLFGQGPDVIVLTEARTTLPFAGGWTLWSEPPIGVRFGEDERKVVLWSKQPWTDIDRVGAPGLDQSRFIAASTATAIGTVRVLGICIPYHMAQVSSPPGPKQRPWQLHYRYLRILTDMLRQIDMPTVIAGDFNQRTPGVKGGNHAAATALEAAFAPTKIVTAGVPNGATRPGIDHIAISGDLQASSVWGWPNHIDDVRISDHDGAGADLTKTS